ncbi:hypothetical protein CK203_082416 [Vitis vinifera]|uniref:Uncharacterized protein n=1 Tax=Vitis vinifera TaxID=29760 RepID=A0A438BNT1_VITVI|nr:hypothetical protein CK203_082416 [Vitis vinifera]
MWTGLPDFSLGKDGFWGEVDQVKGRGGGLRSPTCCLQMIRLRVNLDKSELISMGSVANVEDLASELGCKWEAYPPLTWGCRWVLFSSLWQLGME